MWIQDYQSPLQMEDIRNIAKLDSLGQEYISKWIGKLKLKTFNLLKP
jgi:hypothetical protein